MTGGLQHFAWSLAESALVFVSRVLTVWLNATYDLSDACARNARASLGLPREPPGEGSYQNPRPP